MFELTPAITRCFTARFTRVATLALLVMLLPASPAYATNPFLISVNGTAPNITLSAAGDQAVFPQAGILDDGSNTPISLRATLVSISAGDSINLRRVGDNPTVVANSGTLAAEVLWEVFNANTGQPISGDPAFLITDVDGRNGNPIESVSAQCAGLTSFTTNGAFVDGVNANNSGAAQTNIRVTESNGSILGEGTQNQNGSQQEGYIQYNWTNVNNWTVNYFATTGGRFFVHDADGDIPFDGTQVEVNLVDLATIKTIVDTPTSELSPEPGQQVVYEIELSNIGPSVATNANITDILPAGLTLISATSPDGIVNNAPAAGGATQIDWSGVTIPVNGAAILTIRAMVDPGVAPGTTLVNTTNTAEADESVCSSRDTLTASFVVSEPPVPSLSVSKSAGTPTVNLGESSALSDAEDTITYSYSVENTGNVVISDIAPVDAGPTFNGVNGTNSLSAFSPLTATLSPGQTQVFTATYVLSQADVDNLANAADTDTAISNTASVNGTPADGVLAAVTPSTAVTGFSIEPSVSIVKASPSISTNLGDSAAISDELDIVNYTFTITNTGNITINNAAPTDQGPTFNGLAATNALSSFSPASANLAPGESQVFTASYPLAQADIDNMASAADPLTAIDNAASVVGDPVGPEPLPSVTSNTVETGFAPAPTMTIVKSLANAGNFDAVGDSIEYEWTVTNTGNVTINSVAISDAGPTFNGAVATNSLQTISPSSVSLAPGESQTFSASYELAQEDIDNMSQASDPLIAIDNVSTLTGTPTGGVFAPLDSNTIETGFAVDEQLSINKSVATPSIGLGDNSALTDAGDTLSYSFDVTNDGDVSISNVVINDSGPTFNGVAGAGTLSVITCVATTLLPAQTTTCSATYTLAQSDIDNAQIGGANAVANTANASGANPNGDTVTSADAAAATTIVADSIIELTKTAAEPTIALGSDASITDPGDTISYELLVENNGNTTLSQVSVSDSLTTVSCPALTADNQPFNNNTGSLLPGDSVTCTASYFITQDDINLGQVVNTAQVSSQDPSGNAVSENDQATVGFTQRSSIELLKTGAPQPTAPGQTITYTFTLENTGNVSISAPQVEDAQCDAPATILTRTVGFVSGDSGSAAENTLDADETWVFECTYVTQASDFAGDGEITNTASATGTPPPGLPAPQSSAGFLVQAVQQTGIALEKVAGVPDASVAGSSTLIDEGDTVTYTFTIENTGNVPLTGISISDPLITNQPTNNIISCPVTELAAGETAVCTATYVVTQDDLNTGTLSNTATVTGTPTTTVPIDPPSAQSGAMVALPPSPSMTVEKSASAIPADVADGTVITYSYELVNNGNVTIDNALPVDVGPTFNGVAGTNSLSAFVPNAPATVPVSLQPGDSQTFTATYEISQADLDNMAAAADPLTAIDNTATAAGEPVNGVLAAVTPSTVETGVAPTPSLTLVKEAALTTPPPPVTAAGDTIDYTFSVNNNGNVSISDVVIDDALCQPSNLLSSPDSGDDNANGILDVNETFVFSCTYTIQQSDIDAGLVQNTATATGQDPAGGSVQDASGSAPDNDTPTDTLLAADPAWIITKSTTSVPTNAGDTLVYTFLLENTGNVTISNIVVEDANCATPETIVGGDVDNNGLLDPTETFTLSCTSVPVTQAQIDAGEVENTVVASGVPSGGVLADAQDTIQTPVAGNPLLSAVKTVSGAITASLGSNPSATDGGDEITYQVVVTNDGNVTIDNVSITDNGPSFGGLAATGTVPSFTCAALTLVPGDSTTCIGVYVLTQADVDNALAAGGIDAIQNTASATGDEPGGASIQSPDSVVTASIDNAASLSVLKTASAPTVNLGADPALTDLGGAGADTITYTIVTTNSGNATLSNVSISDPLLDGAPLDCTPFSNDGTESLNVGQSVTCTATYVLEQSDLDAGGVTNLASAAGTDPAGAAVVNSDEVVTPLTQNTSVSLLKEVDTTNFAGAIPVPGDSITYTFTLENTGNVSLSSPTVDDPLCDAPPVLVSGDVDGDGILAASETFEFSCTNTLEASDINNGDVENTATGSGTPPADSGLPDPSATANAIAVIEQESSISLIKMAGIPSVNVGDPSRTDEGDTISYTFDVTNTGNVTLSNIVLSDPLITNAPNNGVITCPATPLNLAAGETAQCTATYTLTQQDIDLGFVMNEASANGTPPVAVEPPPAASSSAMVPITPEPSLSVDKSVSALPANVVAGDLITYTFVVENTGNVTIDKVLPDDNGPTFNNQPATNALSAFDVEPNIVELAPGASQTFTATYELSQVDLDNIAAAADSQTAANNTAIAFGVPANGVLAPVEPSPAQTGVTTSPAIELSKTSVAPSPAVVGANIVYTFVLDNVGNVSIANPVISDAQCQVPGSALNFTSGFVSGDAGQVGILDVGESWEFSCTYALTQADIDAGTVQNSAIASGTEPGGDTISDTSDSGNPADDGAGDADPTNTPLVQTPAWTVDKTTASVPTAAADTLVYNFVLRNTGNVTISSPVISDAKCVAPITLVSGDTDGNGNISPNEVFNYSCTSIPVTQGEVDAGQVINSVSVTGTPPNGIVVPPATDTLITPVARTAGFDVEKTTTSVPTEAGQTLLYNFAVSNSGNVSISNLVVTDAKCATPIVLASGDADNDTALDPNEIFTFSCTSIAVTQLEVDAGVVTNSVTVNGAPPAGVTAPPAAQDLLDTPIVSAPTMSLVKTAALPSVANGSIATVTDVLDTIEYDIEITNTGNTTLSNINVQDSIAAVDCLPFVVGTDTLAPDQSITCNATYTLQQADFDVQNVTNVASVQANDPNGSSVGAQDTVDTPLVQTPLLSLVKATAGDSILNADGSFDQAFDFELLNIGTAALTDVEIVDDLTVQFGACFDSVVDPGVIELIDNALVGNSLNITTGVFPVLATAGSLAPADSIIISAFTARFNPNAVGCVLPNPAQNSAQASGLDDPQGPPISDTSDSGSDPLAAGPNDGGVPTEFTPPTVVPELGIAKAGQATAFNEDGSFEAQFTILLQNTGNIDLSNLSLFDDLSSQYGAAFTPSAASNTSNGVIIAPVVSVVTDAPGTPVELPILDAGYSGNAGNIFDGNSGLLGVGDVIQVQFSIRAEPGNLAILPETFENTANGSGQAPDGSVASDLSDAGSDPTVGAGGATSPTVITLDDIASLPIVLGMLSSERVSPNLVRIEWQTQTEVANLGFNVYARVGDEWQIVNPQVIPGNGDSVAVVRYSYLAETDSDVIALSDISARGDEVLHGPFRVGQTYGQTSERKLIDWSTAIERRQTKEQLREARRKEQMRQRNVLRRQRLEQAGG